MSICALSRAAIGGDSAALARLHARLTPGLSRHFARKLGPGEPRASDEADELTHRTWIAFWEALRDRKYDPAKARLTTFLYAVSHIVWMRRGREVGRAPNDGRAVSDATADRAAGPADAAEIAGTLDLLRGVVAGIEGPDEFSEADRQALRGVAADRTDRELAEEMGVSPSTAHSRKKSALDRLAGFLRKRGHGAEPGRAPPGFKA